GLEDTSSKVEDRQVATDPNRVISSRRSEAEFDRLPFRCELERAGWALEKECGKERLDLVDLKISGRYVVQEIEDRGRLKHLRTRPEAVGQMVEDLGRGLLDELAVAAADRENGDTLKPLLEIV